MPLRMKLFGSLFVVLMMVSINDEMRFFNNVADVFIGLGLFLVIAVIIMWPNPSRAERIDRALEGKTWADRIKIESKGNSGNSD